MSVAAVHWVEMLYILSEIEDWSCVLLCSQFHLLLVESWLLYFASCYFGNFLTPVLNVNFFGNNHKILCDAV
jgi:hypothetical protein